MGITPTALERKRVDKKKRERNRAREKKNA